MSRGDELKIDTTQPSIARVYDAFLGGRDNYEVDRAVYKQILEIAPEAASSGRMCRAWLTRVVRYLAGPGGIDQFLDCGSGLPTAENTHQVAQRANPEAKVVYVDNDPMVAAHGRVLLEENDFTHFAVADLRKPDELLSHPTVTGNLDFNRPIAVIHSNTLHHVADEDRPKEVIGSYVDAMPAGSYLAISHLHLPPEDSPYRALGEETQAKFIALMGTCHFRSREEIGSFFEGAELVDPGLSYLYEWWPDGPLLEPAADGFHLLLGGLAHKR